MAEDPLPLGKQAWESFGQFTVPEVAKGDPSGRATLYLAGYGAGYQAGLLAGRSQHPKCKACGGEGGRNERGGWYECRSCKGKGY